ncbi:hypothetical protein BDZ91DRAFT_709713 [Kalaharituber pfeilii]|nr:hypothetical protein BDZ91DRAFT_709713 [Kalaharituber pfeilii]
MWPIQRSSGTRTPFENEAEPSEPSTSETSNPSDSKGKSLARSETENPQLQPNEESARIILKDVAYTLRHMEEFNIDGIYDATSLSSLQAIQERKKGLKLPASISEAHDRLLMRAKEVLEYFVPENMESEVIWKYWGALDDIVYKTPSALSVPKVEKIEAQLALIAKKAQAIRSGVSSTNADHPSYYRVPVDLVQAFVMLLEALLLYGYGGSFAGQKAGNTAVHECLESMQEAVYQLLTMLHVGDYSHGAVIELVGRHNLLGLVLLNLLSGSSTSTWGPMEEFDTLTYFLRKTNKLRFQIQRRPRRQLLGDVHSVTQGLAAVHAILLQQHHCLSLAQTPEYHPDKYFSYEYCTEFVDSKITWLRQLQDNVHWLPAQLLQLLDADKDSNDKAIVAFTTVTVIFLPLSFVCSYLGMNTIDIREMDRGVWIFWATAVPVTFVTVLATLIIAFQWEKLRDLLEDVLEGQLKRHLPGYRRQPTGAGYMST